MRSSPAVAEGAVYVGSDDGSVYAIDAETGMERWAFATGDEVAASPAVADGIVYIGSLDDSVYALDAETGEERWRLATGSGVFRSPVVADGVVYTGFGILYAIAIGG